MSAIDTVTCPENCTTALPVFSFSKCAPKPKPGQIVKVYYGTTPFDDGDGSDSAAWAARLPVSESDQNETDDDALRVLTVIGDLPVPEKQTKEISGGRTATPQKNFTLNATIDDLTDANYNAARATNCGGTYLMWFEDSAGYIYGGDEGIEASVDMDHLIPQSRDEFQSLLTTWKWKSQFPPVRIAKPF